ncbi:hypothetical protein CSE45_4953 [Citreicella sp. SE45]|nr:hypothetical protein CSE45_4953 [Citreicella sp. SE45]
MQRRSTNELRAHGKSGPQSEFQMVREYPRIVSREQILFKIEWNALSHVKK